MKKLLLLFALVIISSCSSNDDTVDFAAENGLTGRWNWVKTTLIQDDTKTVTPQSENKTVVIEFSGDTYKEFNNGVLAYQKTFKIITQNSIFGGQKKMIVFTGPPDNHQTFVAIPITSLEITGTKLILKNECLYCTQSEYDLIR